MRIVLLGAPGSGKGTQARKLVELYKVPQISTGEILRTAAAEGTEAGRKAEQIMAEGNLVPDALVIELVSQRVLKADSRRGFILDGFPRNIPQAQELDTRLGWVSRPIQMVVNFEVDEGSLIKRLTGRRICESCGAIFNIHMNRPRSNGKCNECGGRLARRDDDNEATVRARLEVYHRETELLVQYYRAQHKLRTLNANGDAEDIFTRLCQMIDTEIRPLESKVVSVHGSEGGATQTQIVGGKIVREVAGVDVRTTRVQPRQAQEAAEVAETDTRSGAKKARGSKATRASSKKAAAAEPSAKSEDAPKKAGGQASSTKKAGKAAAKKSTAKKKPTAKKGAAKKAAVKKAKSGSSGGARKKAASKKIVKKTTAKKATAKKSARKTAAGKTVAKKAAVKKTAGKKTTARKSAAKKSTAKKSTAKKSTAKKSTAKKAPVRVSKKAAAKKVAKKTATKKAVARKASAKKTPARKTTTKKSTARKSAVKKKLAKKTVSKKTTARKSPAKKKAVRKTPAARRSSRKRTR